MKIAFIDGITGQDGSYLAELLLEKGYEVHGMIRRSSSFNTERLDSVFDKLNLHYGDLSDGLNVYHLIEKVRPDEYYHLGAQSQVRTSFEIPVYTGDITGLGTARVLEAIKEVNSKIRFYNAGSSEMYGKVQETPQTETTPFYPRSPYGCAKVYSYWLTKNYREAYGMFACSGILFNHESPRRGGTFVTKKIVDYVRDVALPWAMKTERGGFHPEPGVDYPKLKLGNLDARRDWGYAKEYVEAMWLMLQQPEPDDFVIATGEAHSVKELLQEAFVESGHLGSWKPFVEIDPKYYRPTEVDLLIGDPSKAKRILGWEAKTKFKDLVRVMMKGGII